jgi:4-hydroxybenzoate polyprenyltransferase
MGAVVAVGATVALSIIRVFTAANGIWVETGVWVTLASCVAALQAIKRRTGNTNKALFTVNMASSFQDYSTIS